MKKILMTVLAAALCLSMLCACGQDGSASSGSTGSAAGSGAGNVKTNETSFNLTTKTLSDVVKGAWVNQDDLSDKLNIADDLSFTNTVGEEVHKGRVKLNEKGGMMTITYDDNYKEERTYIWVDNKSKINGNTWYVDGATYAFGGTIYIRE